jgi:hypothetical protein
MPLLDAETPNDPVSLSDTELTVKVQRADREDFLWEIGSSSNWLSYHVAITLALHQFFLSPCLSRTQLHRLRSTQPSLLPRNVSQTEKVLNRSQNLSGVTRTWKRFARCLSPCHRPSPQPRKTSRLSFSITLGSSFGAEFHWYTKSMTGAMDRLSFLPNGSIDAQLSKV